MEIYAELNALERASSDCERLARELNNIQHTFRNITGGLDWNVKSKASIQRAINELSDRLYNAKTAVSSHASLLEEVRDKYFEIEKFNQEQTANLKNELFGKSPSGSGSSGGVVGPAGGAVDIGPAGGAVDIGPADGPDGIGPAGGADSDHHIPSPIIPPPGGAPSNASSAINSFLDANISNEFASLIACYAPGGAAKVTSMIAQVNSVTSALLVSSLANHYTCGSISVTSVFTRVIQSGNSFIKQSVTVSKVVNYYYDKKTNNYTISQLASVSASVKAGVKLQGGGIMSSKGAAVISDRTYKL